jgi:hypothetical protein
VEELACPVANVTETLDNEGTVLQTLWKSNFIVEALMVNHQFTETIVNAKTS